MPNERAKDDAVVEVNFGAATLRELPLRPPAAPRGPPSLVDVLRTIGAERWLIVAVVLGVLALSATYLFLATPIYESSLVLQIEDRSQKLTGLEDLSDFMGAAASPAETEIEIIRSRTLIGARRRRARARRPGDAAARTARGRSARAQMAGRRARSGALGARALRLGRRADRGPGPRGRGRASRRDARAHRARWRSLPDWHRRGGGNRRGGRRVPVPPAGRRRAGSRSSSASSSRGPGTQFLVVKHDRSSLVSAIRSALRVQETGKKTDILVATFEGVEPQRVADILNAIGRVYMRRNVDRKSAEAAQMLAFLESQLPELKAGVDAAESAMNAFQRNKRPVDVSQESQAMLERAVRVEGSPARAAVPARRPPPALHGEPPRRHRHPAEDRTHAGAEGRPRQADPLAPRGRARVRAADPRRQGRLRAVRPSPRTRRRSSRSRARASSGTSPCSTRRRCRRDRAGLSARWSCPSRSSSASVSASRRSARAQGLRRGRHRSRRHRGRGPASPCS